MTYPNALFVGVLSPWSWRYSNDDGSDLNISTVTGSDGSFSLKGLPEGVSVGLLALGGMDVNGQRRIDTYTYNVNSNEKDRIVYSVQVVISQIVENQIPIDTNKATVSGAVYWDNPRTGALDPVDCVTVEIEGATGDIYYFGPNKLPDHTKTFKETQLNGRFYLANVAPPQVTINAMVNGAKIGSATMPLVAAKDCSTAKDYAYNISITRIIIPGATDPTPAGCNAQ